ncbi:MAG: RNA polymerase sigma factor [Planctomycetes bacterium]|nr:RNA polymerase sigma factor [Planctomycetota bacterium]
MSEGPPRDDEAELIRRARAGEPEAFGLLAERHLRRTYRAALALVGAREPALDLTQEALLRVFEARGRLDPGRPFFPFLYQALRRRCFNWLRDERGRARRLAAECAFVARAPRPDDDPTRQAEVDDEHRRVVGAIEALPAREREVLVLKDVEGLRYREIADLVGVPLGTVMSRLYSARRRVALALEGEA